MQLLGEDTRDVAELVTEVFVLVHVVAKPERRRQTCSYPITRPACFRAVREIPASFVR